MTEEFRLPPRVGSYVRLTGGEDAGRSFRVQSIDSEGHCHLLPLEADADFRMRVPASEVVVITEQEMIENGGETAAEAGFRAERAARRAGIPAYVHAKIDTGSTYRAISCAFFLMSPAYFWPALSPSLAAFFLRAG